MFTVVIAGKEHTNAIKDYEIFLNPLVERSHIQFCEWRPDEDTLTEAVPMLRDTVGNCEEWRAILLCDDRGINEKNPFDLIKPRFPEYPDIKVSKELTDKMTADEREEYLDQLELQHEKDLKEYYCFAEDEGKGVRRVSVAKKNKQDGEIFFFRMVSEPDSCGKWKIFSIEREGKE